MTKDKQSNLSMVRITKDSLEKLKVLAEKKNLKIITILEYILSGKISIKELK